MSDPKPQPPEDRFEDLERHPIIGGPLDGGSYVYVAGYPTILDVDYWEPDDE